MYTMTHHTTYVVLSVLMYLQMADNLQQQVKELKKMIGTARQQSVINRNALLQQQREKFDKEKLQVCTRLEPPC